MEYLRPKRTFAFSKWAPKTTRAYENGFLEAADSDVQCLRNSDGPNIKRRIVPSTDSGHQRHQSYWSHAVRIGTDNQPSLYEPRPEFSKGHDEAAFEPRNEFPDSNVSISPSPGRNIHNEQKSSLLQKLCAITPPILLLFAAQAALPFSPHQARWFCEVLDSFDWLVFIRASIYVLCCFVQIRDGRPSTMTDEWCIWGRIRTAPVIWIVFSPLMVLVKTICPPPGMTGGLVCANGRG